MVAAAAAVVAAGADAVLVAAFLLSDGNLPANTNPATGSASTATAIARRRRYTLAHLIALSAARADLGDLRFAVALDEVVEIH